MKDHVERVVAKHGQAFVEIELDHVHPALHAGQHVGVVDLDAVAMQVYTPEMLVQMSQKLAAIVQHINVETRPIDEQIAQHLIKQAKLGGVSIPRLVNQATLGLLKADTEEGQYELGV
ncbi:hypothetical protein SDC9_110609 [bioreactor metagenome]|uniref:Uncharacterized protein n=1 Tax=bioreactor metagenome TaxID=1076179 RepID=A0A645BEG9_9ZZZZ